jgi:hypothetical protein
MADAHHTGTVAAIPANPRYTGRQIWNGQSIDHHENVPGDKGQTRRAEADPRRTCTPRAGRGHQQDVRKAQTSYTSGSPPHVL